MQCVIGYAAVRASWLEESSLASSCPMPTLEILEIPHASLDLVVANAGELIMGMGALLAFSQYIFVSLGPKPKLTNDFRVCMPVVPAVSGQGLETLPPRNLRAIAATLTRPLVDELVADHR